MATLPDSERTAALPLTSSGEDLKEYVLSNCNELPDSQIDAHHRYYNSPIFSDVVICFDNRRVYAHKIILSLASPYFRSAFAGLFRESSSKEMSLHDDDDHEAVDGMLRHIYGLDHGAAAQSPGPYFSLRIFAVAGKYGLPKLLDKAVQEVWRELETGWDMPTFVPMVYSIYEEVPRHGGQLRGLVQGVCVKHFMDLMQMEEFEEMLLKVPDLSVQLLKVCYGVMRASLDNKEEAVRRDHANEVMRRR
ncbi:BTB POZ domain [Lecanosticta acicola]|uniref:BTB POZ domain n=1 Tax=Lecanosticta acicola TaxID=111012 RepID=A0AAI9EBI7_9PEZI|nr:BTB POZ domain [Lecanosticta acicola]